MISADMRQYKYYLYGEKNAYGQTVFSTEPAGTIKISINTTSTAIQDNVRYKDATYLGLTSEPVTDKYVIEYGEEKLKVLYVLPKGRLKQVFLKNI